MAPRTIVQRKPPHPIGMPMLKLALAGCGKFARRYHVPAIASDPSLRVTVICDVGVTAAVRLGARTTTMDDLWVDDACDAVIVSTPHRLHGPHAAACLAHEKRVLVDKPFVLTSAEARELTENAQSRGVLAGVAFNRRLDAACQHARDADGSPGAATINFAAAVRNAERSACSFAEACISLRMIEAAFASAAAGEGWRPV